MAEILTKAGCFVAIIFLGWLLRHVGFFKEEDFGVIAKIVLKITLPASIVYSFSGKEIDGSMFLLCLLGFGFGLIYMAVGYLISLHQGKEQKAFSVLNLSGYNISNFTMPFVQSFLGTAGMTATVLFDTGNTFICLGTAYSIAAMIVRGDKFSPLRILHDLLKSIPFVTYLVMLILSLLHIRLPSPITEFANIVGKSNAFLAMLMLGVGFNLPVGKKKQTGMIVKMLCVRYGVAALIAALCWFVLPLEPEVRKALVILAFSPISSAVPAFTGELKGDTGLSSAINSISIVISVVCIVAILCVL